MAPQATLQRVEKVPEGGMAARVGPYRLEEPLGQGGMGRVWRAWDERLRRRVAVKQIRTDSTIPGAREKFRREAQMAARLNHPAIVTVYDLLEDGNQDWMVMELVCGRTLRSLLDAEGPLSPARAVLLGREIAEGLSEAHEQGVLHRDLKTRNVMVTPSWHAKILDFGLAEELPPEGGARGEAVSTSPLCGTSYAMSPEQVLGLPLDPLSDLFSLGSLLYELLTGEPPFRSESPAATLERVVRYRPRPLRESCPEVPQELAGMVEQLLEKDPHGRPRSARQVAGTLTRLAAALPGPEGDRTFLSELRLRAPFHLLQEETAFEAAEESTWCMPVRLAAAEIR